MTPKKIHLVPEKAATEKYISCSIFCFVLDAEHVIRLYQEVSQNRRSDYAINDG